MLKFVHWCGFDSEFWIFNFVNCGCPQIMVNWIGCSFVVFFFFFGDGDCEYCVCEC